MKGFNLIRSMYRQLDNMVHAIREAAVEVETTDDIKLRDMLVEDIGKEYLKVDALATRIVELNVEVPQLPFYASWAEEAVEAAAEIANRVEAFQRMQNYLAAA